MGKRRRVGLHHRYKRIEGTVNLMDTLVNLLFQKECCATKN